MHRAPWWKTWRLVSLLSLIAWGETGCVAVLSTQVRQQADRTVSLAQVRAMPAAYLGRTIVVGGDIVRTSNVPGATWLEVLQKPLDSEDKPILTDQSEGVFMVRCDRYLDPLTYTAGRVVTVAGRVLGIHTEKVGERDDVYPLLSCVEIYLWPQALYFREVYPDIWYWWEWDPWYGDPWSWRPHHHHFRGWRPHRRK